MSGRLLDAVRIVPPMLWRHLGVQLSITPPELTSLRALYQRAQTLRDHHQIACRTLGFRGRTSRTGVPCRVRFATNLLGLAIATGSWAWPGSGCTSIG